MNPRFWRCRLVACSWRLAAVLFFAFGARAQTNNEVAGVIVFETENFATNIVRSGYSWVFNNVVAGFSGTGYMEALPNNGANIQTNWNTTSPELQFTVNFATAGTHYVWVRAYATTNTDDSVHAGLDGATNTAANITLVQSQYTNWSWTTNVVSGPAPTVSGAVGLHTFSLWMREDGMRVDRVVLETATNFQAIVGNSWHIPNGAEPGVGLTTMRVPFNGIQSNTPVTVYNGNQFQGTGNAANQASSSTMIFYRNSTNSVWSSEGVTFFGQSGNNKYFSNAIPANIAAPGETVQYYWRIGYTDRLPTFLYGNDGQSFTTELESAAQANPFSYTIQGPISPSGPYLSFDSASTTGTLEARIYQNSGYIALVGPDLSGNPLTNTIVFAPPSVTVGGNQYSVGAVLSSTTLSNGLQLTQQIAGTNVISQLTFPTDGVMRYEVVNWNGLVPTQTSVAGASDASEHFYGFGEKFNAFDQSGHLVHILTFDQAGDKQDFSYKVAPWFISTKGYGFHLDSTAESYFDMRAGYADRYVASNLFSTLKFNVVYGPNLTNVLSRYTGYTGRPALPPMWAFAPWMSSDIWHTGGEVRYVITKYRALGIPGSVFVFDSPWEVGYNDFTWNMTQFGAGGTYEGTNYNGFTSVSDMMTFIQTNGFKVMCWLTPFVNTSSVSDGVGGQNTGQSTNYAAGAASNYFVRASVNGPPLVENWWKGTGSPVDFTSPSATQWLQGQLSNLVAQSGGVIGGFKTDDGESASSDGSTYIPTTAVYSDGRTGVEMRNGFCVTYHKAIWNVLGTNGLVMARSGFTGSQAYPGCWAGDNQPNFGSNGLPGVIVASQSAAMSGFSIWGSDIGGYQDGNFSSTPTNLFMRWTQFGAFSPIMEMHRQTTAGLQYPWSFGPDGLSNYQFYTQLHTALFPYIYTYALQGSSNGLPIMRPLILMNQTDTNIYGIQQTYMIGDELLVSPIITNVATSRVVYLPQGTWYDFFSGQVYAGAQNITWMNTNQAQMPIFAKQGAIIPMISTNVQSFCDPAYINNTNIVTMDNSLQFLVYPATNSSFTVYDGTSLQCQSNGTVVTLSLSSVARPVSMQVLGIVPFSVEQNGVTLAKYTNAGSFAAASAGWMYNAAQNFVQVKFNHTGGAAQISFGPDSVGDGISDSWRLYHFGNATATNAASCAQCDADGDGFSNIKEYVAGTDPNVASSVLRIMNVTADGVVTWSSVPGRVYQVYATTNLNTPFAGISGTIVATNGTSSFVDPGFFATGKFYQIGVFSQ